MLRRKRKDMGGIPTASMSDVAFLLLVFFLSTTKFDIKKGLGINLPAASQKADKKVRLKEENITKVWIDADGVITLKTKDSEETVSMNQLESKVRKIVFNNPDMVVSLKTDRKSKYQNMVKALDRLQAAGAEKISLSTN
ncbi:MAG: biopolymer transporter ExbD [Candidatus Cloacimonetes bacterium]|nr:biopolymer transporter ExbD [Candidatus Cloacimonadota bacterium]MCF7813042.1 biopolymer transporter ExbD [Candidatus Cloacimonadota bacterium]MCF7867217.1 biopolymer transporter ExbD [Candidatus Cloacimonadota bacterium]MCF7882661.1 biopolymer transporter ExbD [Candidatus Cloacimonadota bacterium]